MNNVTKSVKSFHPWQSVIQTINDIVKAQGGELKVETKEACPYDPRLNDSVGQTVGRGEGSQFIILLPVDVN